MCAEHCPLKSVVRCNGAPPCEADSSLVCSYTRCLSRSLRPPLTERTTNSDRYTAKANGSRVSMRASPAPAAPRARRRGATARPGGAPARRVSLLGGARVPLAIRNTGIRPQPGTRRPFFIRIEPVQNPESKPERVQVWQCSSPLALRSVARRCRWRSPSPWRTAAHGLSCVKERGATTPATLPEPVAARRAGALV